MVNNFDRHLKNTFNERNGIFNDFLEGFAKDLSGENPDLSNIGNLARRPSRERSPK